MTHTIDTGESPPIKQPARRVPFALRQAVDENQMVEKMLSQGVVEPSQQVRMQEKKAFATPSCLYEFRVMPFWLLQFTSHFSKTYGKHSVRTDKEVVYGVVYIDDVLVIGKTFAEYLANLKEVFMRLRAAGLRLKSRKCFFGTNKVVHLGFVVSREGISRRWRR